MSWARKSHRLTQLYLVQDEQFETETWVQVREKSEFEPDSGTIEAEEDCGQGEVAGYGRCYDMAIRSPVWWRRLGEEACH